MIWDEIDPLYEMSNFGTRTTGLPSGIDIWTRTEPTSHGHSVYRVKVTKDNKWAAIFLVSTTPKMIKNINDSLQDSEISQIQNFIATHKSALINLTDGRIDSGECGMAIMKKRGEQ